MKLLLIIFITINLNYLNAQNNFSAIIFDKGTELPLEGATAIIEELKLGDASNSNGLIKIKNIPDGEYSIKFSYVGYTSQTIQLTLTKMLNDTLIIYLEADHELLEDIEISSTRSSRTIKDIPTRVETIAGEELDEKSNMKSGDIRMLLNESTGIMVQQTSATSANASIRIQGLDGRYTQILKDGFPAFSGAAGGLGLLQTPPLDLMRVEVIKGSASTLYGGGAIAGLVNLISKKPEKDEIYFHLNGTSGLGYDLIGFYTNRFEKTGVTIFASKNYNKAYDPSHIGLTAIPEFDRYVFNPKFFYYINENIEWNTGLNIITENRLGGDIKFINEEKDISQSYFEKNNTDRYSFQSELKYKINEAEFFNMKNYAGYFNRKIELRNYNFHGKQTSIFNEITYILDYEKSEWINGINLWYEDYKEIQFDTNIPQRNFNNLTVGAFIQNLANVSDKINIESGIRADYIKNYGLIFLPRLSILFKLNENFTSRLGGGFGYKSPEIFNEESEKIHFRNILPIDFNINKLEKSYGVNLDFNYRNILGDEITFNINQLFFYTYLNNPLSLELLSNGLNRFVNIDGHIDTKGIETNIKLGYSAFKLFLGYTFTDTKFHQNEMTFVKPLTPKNRFNSILMYEVEDEWRIGLEFYYFGEQTLSDDSKSKDFTITGFMVEKIWESFSIYINFENFLDTRQTRFDTIYTGTLSNPIFKDIYAPLDGFIINGGIKLKL